jgi:hypothetical protein
MRKEVVLVFYRAANYTLYINYYLKVNNYPTGTMMLRNAEVVLDKLPLGRPRRRWVDNIRMDLREIGWDGMDWIGTSGGLL